jgi:hypothetical protein
MTTPFDESEHPRDSASGEFSTKNQSTPEVMITPAQAEVEFSRAEILELADNANGPLILELNGGLPFHPYNGYIDETGGIVLEGDEDEETNAISAGQLKSLIDMAGEDFTISYYSDAPEFIELKYARVDDSNQLTLTSQPTAVAGGPVRPLDIVAYRVNGGLMTPEAAYAVLYKVDDEDDDNDSGNERDDLERALGELAASQNIDRRDVDALESAGIPVHLYAENLEGEDYRQLGLTIPRTSTDWDDLGPDEHLFFENDGGPRAGWIEIHRTSEETDADNGIGSQVWAEAGQGFELTKVLPDAASDDGASLERHQNTIDTWLRATYNDGRFIEGPNGYDAHILFSVDESDSLDGKFPATKDGVLALVAAKAEIVQLKDDLASGAFYERLREVIAAAESE